MSAFKIDGVEIPFPSSFTVNIEDISSKDSGRILNGDAYKDIVATKVTLEMSWQVLKWEECASILNAVEGKDEMEVTYPDPRIPFVYTTKLFYVGGRKNPALSLIDGKVRWRGTAFNLIQI